MYLQMDEENKYSHISLLISHVHSECITVDRIWRSTEFIPFIHSALRFGSGAHSASDLSVATVVAYSHTRLSKGSVATAVLQSIYTAHKRGQIPVRNGYYSNFRDRAPSPDRDLSPSPCM